MLKRSIADIHPVCAADAGNSDPVDLAQPLRPHKLNSTDALAISQRLPDRRDSQRYRAVMRAARLSSCIHNVQGLGLVRNISEGGMLVESRLNFEIGESVMVALLDGDRIEGEVVWQDGNSVGIKFCSWISVDAVLDKSSCKPSGLRPRSPRLAIDRAITIKSESFLADARMFDISQRGAKLHFLKQLPIDCRIQISCHGNQPVTGSVKWQAGDLLGMEFHRVLGIEELASWTAVNGNNAGETYVA